MKKIYWVVCYDEESNSFSVDTSTTEAVFPDGPIFDDRWFYPQSPSDVFLDEEKDWDLRQSLEGLNQILIDRD